MSKVTKVSLAATIMASSLYLSGCGLFTAGEKEKIDPPKDVSYVEDEAALEKQDGENKETSAGQDETAAQIKTELYLIDKNGYVVAQTLDLPKAEGVAKQALEYLVENGPVSELLPNGFRAVLPADTAVDVDIKDGVATADFSKEFGTYKAEDEMKILQAVTWTLTQFDSVAKVKLKMNGHELDQMPVNGTPISDGVSRADGINMDLGGVADISNTKALTVYYIGGEEGSYYYVPVTKRIKGSETDNVAAVINELKKEPGYASNLLTEFMPDLELVDKPMVEKGIAKLNFNESILGSFEEKKISERVMNALVLSLTEQKDIKSVEVKVNGSAKLMNEEGKPMTEPVSRPEKVNTGSF